MRMLPLLLTVLLAPAAHAAQSRPELWLAGGALQLCSELAPRACRPVPAARATARHAAQVVIDRDGVERALAPLLWQSPDAPSPVALRAMLTHAIPVGGGRALSMDDAADLLHEVCLRAASPADGVIDCEQARTETVRPWQQLLDEERSAILSALELPQFSGDQRHTERAYPLSSADPGGAAVMQGFVEAARARAGGGTPTIAVVTASAYDTFDAVDFYLDLFRALGAQVQWWPIDAALNAAVASGRCEALDDLREQHLRVAARARVYPDLVEQQRLACESPDTLVAVPGKVQGMFFSGGDQWRLRRALVDAQGNPNPWLRALRQAHAAGTLVVGGTSAGAAVQSGAAMLSNGGTAEALRTGAVQAPPPPPGCDRAQRCAAGVVEDSFTWWPEGGTGLAAAATVDTHFSERGRELRLLTLMHASTTALGYGVDETSALQVIGDDTPLSVQAHGAHGGWVFERVRETEGGGLQARVHYLAPEVSFSIQDQQLQVPAGLQVRLEPAIATPSPSDALASAALRQAAAVLAGGQRDSITLEAGAGTATLSRTQATRAWRARNGQVGIVHLELRYDPAPVP